MICNVFGGTLNLALSICVVDMRILIHQDGAVALLHAVGCVTQCSQSAAHSYEQFLQVQQIGFITFGPLRHA